MNAKDVVRLMSHINRNKSRVVAHSYQGTMRFTVFACVSWLVSGGSQL